LLIKIGQQLKNNGKEASKMDKHDADSKHEGRDKRFMDVDRMINEGLGGGTVNLKYDKPAIDEARNLEEENPPRKSK
jgi:hypothetical protein